MSVPGYVARTACAVLLAAAFALPAGPGVLAHETGAAGQADAASGAEHALTVRLAPDGSAPPTVQVPLGAHVRLTVVGAGTGTLHLHGYDVEVAGREGVPAVFVFDAVHAGRFPLEAHVTDDLLGEHASALLFVEVRAP